MGMFLARTGSSLDVKWNMNKTIGLQLVIYSLLLAGLSFLVHSLAPSLARPTLITGLIGGLICLILGFRAMGGSRGKALSVLTLIPITFVMLSQAVSTWVGTTQVVEWRRTAAALISLLLALSFGMLLRIAYAGVQLYMEPGKPARGGELRS